MSEFLIKAAQLITALSILVVLHEFGHYIPAKLFKTRVEKFYLFFNPWFSLFKKKIGETEWGIGWLPLGGYVKISGMVDESMDKEQLAKPAQPWEFRSKPAWQRLIIMIGGVTVNVILGIVIYICVFYAYGETKVDPLKVEKGLSVAPILEKYGFRQGDVVLATDGKKVEDAVDDVNSEIMLRNAARFVVMHQDGTKETLTLPEDIDYQLFKSGMTPISYPSKIRNIDSVYKDSPAYHGGLKKKDRIVSVNGKQVALYGDFSSELYRNRGKQIELVVNRSGKQLIKEVTVSKEGTIGVMLSSKLLLDTNIIERHYYTFGESISRGTAFGLTTLSDYASQLKYIFTQKGATSVGGFTAIGKMFPSSWNWQAFWMITALLSMILAFMNILPIPALDGGHVVFLIYEMVTGKEAPQKVLEYAQIVGFVLLMSLLLYANGNDLYKAVFGS